jgi:hypothetical protein
MLVAASGAWLVGLGAFLAGVGGLLSGLAALRVARASKEKKGDEIAKQGNSTDG